MGRKSSTRTGSLGPSRRNSELGAREKRWTEGAAMDEQGASTAKDEARHDDHGNGRGREKQGPGRARSGGEAGHCRGWGRGNARQRELGGRKISEWRWDICVRRLKKIKQWVKAAEEDDVQEINING
jgi:hypothetical protein